jgi:Cu-Zn family superoxide dismutase
MSRHSGGTDQRSIMKSTRVGIVGVGLAGLLIAWAGTAGAGAGNSEVVGQGPDFINTAVSPNPLAGAAVTVSAGEIGGGNLQITLDVTGVDAPAGTRLGAHIHVNPCGTTATAAGGHFQNPDGGTPLEQREVWLDFTVDANGSGHSVATRNWEVSNLSGRSLVIHAMSTDRTTGVAGPRLVCTDLD